MAMLTIHCVHTRQEQHSTAQHRKSSHVSIGMVLVVLMSEPATEVSDTGSHSNDENCVCQVQPSLLIAEVTLQPFTCHIIQPRANVLMLTPFFVKADDSVRSGSLVMYTCSYQNDNWYTPTTEWLRCH